VFCRSGECSVVDMAEGFQMTCRLALIGSGSARWGELCDGGMHWSFAGECMACFNLASVERVDAFPVVPCRRPAVG
jgi:hypothetical protein